MLLVHYLEVLPEISDKISNKEKNKSTENFLWLSREISNDNSAIIVRNEWIEQDA